MNEATVVIPTYNRPEHIERALRALADQSEDSVPFSVVVVDDGSTPAVETTPALYPFDLTVVRLESNRGRSAARNAGLAAVRSPLVIFVDDDIRVSPGFVRAFCEALDATRPVVGLGMVHFHPDIPRDPLTRYLETRGIAKLRVGDPIPFKYFLTYNSAAPAQLLRDVGGFSEQLKVWGGEDIELAWRLHQHGATFVRVPEACAVHAHRRSLNDVLQLSEVFAREGMPTLFAAHPPLVRLLKADLLGPSEYAVGNSANRLAVRLVTKPGFARALQKVVERFPHAPWPAKAYDYLIASAWRRGLDASTASTEKEP